jgi:hypothetical protein
VSPTTATPQPLDLVPDPEEILDRLGELTREQTLLKRQLRVSLAARRERERLAQTEEGGQPCQP